MAKCDISQLASTSKCKSNKTKLLDCNMFFFDEIRASLKNFNEHQRQLREEERYQ